MPAFFLGLPPLAALFRGKAARRAASDAAGRPGRPAAALAGTWPRPPAAGARVALDTDRLLAVVSQEGTTMVAPIDDASREAIRSHLYTPGELLRLDQLEPSREDLKRQGQTRLVQSKESDV